MSKNNLITLLTLGTVATVAMASEGVFWASPELESVKWESRQLTAGDYNGDGRTDIAVINGVERSIDLFLQTQELKMVSRPTGKLTEPLNVLTRFNKVRISLGSAPSSFVFGDFDGNGRLDLAYASTREGLVFMEQSADHQWSVVARVGDVKPTAFIQSMWWGGLSKELPLPVMPVVAEDKPDNFPAATGPCLVVLAEGQVVVLRDRAVVARYGCLRKDASFLNVTDINGDGLMDLVYEYPGSVGVAYRLQTSDHRFDAERVLPYDYDNEKIFGFSGPNFYFFGGKTPTVEVRNLIGDPLTMEKAVYANSGEISDAAWVDLDNDGQPELVCADGRGGQVTVWKHQGNGFVCLEDFPTLKGVSSIVGVGTGSVALFSPEEKSIGIASFDTRTHRLGFPKLLDLSGDPVALLGIGERAWVVSRDDKDFYIQAISSGQLDKNKNKLEGLKRAPDDFGVYGETSGDVLLVAYQGRDQAQPFVLSSNTVSEAKVTTALARANFTGLDSNRVAWVSLAGKSYWVIAQRTSIRLFSFEGGRIELADQTLPVEGDVSLRLPFVNDGKLWAYEGRSKRWETFARNEKGLFSVVGFYDALPFDPQKVLSDSGRFLALGQKAFGVYAPAVAGKTLKTIDRFESNVDLDGYNCASLEKLSPNEDFAILFNQNKRIIEFVSLAKPMASRSNFTLYEMDPHYEGRKGEQVEPREFISADVTGDGLADMIFLMHDKLAVYPRVIPAKAK